MSRNAEKEAGRVFGTPVDQALQGDGRSGTSRGARVRLRRRQHTRVLSPAYRLRRILPEGGWDMLEGKMSGESHDTPRRRFEDPGNPQKPQTRGRRQE